MAFIGRWLAATALAFVLFPVAFVLSNRPDGDFGLLDAIVIMMFLQFLSPFNLWLIPLWGGTGLAVAWQVLAPRKA